MYHTDAVGRRTGEIEDAAPDERPAIINADDDGATIAAVGDAQLGAKTKGSMGGRQAARIHPLAGGGAGMKRIP